MGGINQTTPLKITRNLGDLQHPGGALSLFLHRTNNKPGMISHSVLRLPCLLICTIPKVTDRTQSLGSQAIDVNEPFNI